MFCEKNEEVRPIPRIVKRLTQLLSQFIRPVLYHKARVLPSIHVVHLFCSFRETYNDGHGRQPD